MIGQVMTWVGPTLDVTAVALLAAVLWRLGRDPGAAWAEREARLATIFADLRGLVAQSEGLARDLDARLADRETRLRALVDEAQAALTAPATTRSAAADTRSHGVEVRGAVAESSTEPSRASEPVRATEPDPAAVAGRIEVLAEAGTPVEEIARRVGVAAAEVRLVIGLKTARTARRRQAAGAARALA